MLDHLGDLAKAGAPAAVIIPVGFVSDHMEVRHDLDTEAAETAAALGLPVARAATPWYHPQFRAMIIDLVRERLGLRMRRARRWASWGRPPTLARPAAALHPAGRALVRRPPRAAGDCGPACCSAARSERAA